MPKICLGEYLSTYYTNTLGTRKIADQASQHILYKKQIQVSASTLARVFYTLLTVHCAWLCKLFWTWTWICATVSQKKEARIMEVWEACLYFHLHTFLEGECHVTCDTQAFIHYHHWYMECGTGILSYLWSSWYGLTLFLGAGCNITGNFSISTTCLQLTIRMSIFSSDGKVMDDNP